MVKAANNGVPGLQNGAVWRAAGRGSRFKAVITGFDGIANDVWMNDSKASSQWLCRDEFLASASPAMYCTNASLQGCVVGLRD